MQLEFFKANLSAFCSNFNLNTNDKRRGSQPVPVELWSITSPINIVSGSCEGMHDPQHYRLSKKKAMLPADVAATVIKLSFFFLPGCLEGHLLSVLLKRVSLNSCLGRSGVNT